MKKRKNLVIVGIVAREILTNYKMFSHRGAFYAASTLWDSYQSYRDKEQYPGQATFYAACFGAYFPRGILGVEAKSKHLPTNQGILFRDLWELIEELDKQ